MKRRIDAGSVAPVQNAARDAAIATNLAVWYGRAARDLPWRRTRDPYRIWLSEVMLQQTRVDTVIPYYERFVARFPDARALADAPLDDVLALWSGLGYYSRARSLHRAAQQIVSEHGGAMPDTVAALLELAGIGPYTAGAIASIAFDAPEPLVDGNVIRVLARVYGVSLDARGTEAQKVFWETAGRLVKADATVPPSVLNQSLMELGALGCTPLKPACALCPLARECVASRDGLTEVLPVLSAKRKPKAVAMVAAVVWQAGRVLLAQRAAQGLFGGMWEPPLVEAATLEEARSPLAAFGLDPASMTPATTTAVKHVLSHRSLSIAVVRASLTSSERPLPSTLPAPYERLAFVDPRAAPGGISTLATKLLDAAPDPEAPLVLTSQPARKRRGR